MPIIKHMQDNVHRSPHKISEVTTCNTPDELVAAWIWMHDYWTSGPKHIKSVVIGSPRVAQENVLL